MNDYLVCTCGDSLGSEDPYCPAHGTPLYPNKVKVLEEKIRELETKISSLKVELSRYKYPDTTGS